MARKKAPAPEQEQEQVWICLCTDTTKLGAPVLLMRKMRDLPKLLAETIEESEQFTGTRIDAWDHFQKIRLQHKRGYKYILTPVIRDELLAEQARYKQMACKDD